MPGIKHCLNIVVFASVPIWLFISSSVQAYFQDAALGVRPAGMGAAFVSIADDANTVLFNPAGFARIKNMEFTGMYSELYRNINARLYNGQTDRLGYNFLSLAIPGPKSFGTFGASWANFQSMFYKENIFALSYGQSILAKNILDFGTNFKVLQWQVEANDYSTDPVIFPFAKRQKTGYTLDIGILSRPLEGLSLGASMDNILPTEMGLSSSRKVPIVMRAGAAFKRQWEKSPVDSLQVSVEWNKRDNVYNTKAGLEIWFFQKALAIRSGINMDAFSAGLSFRYIPRAFPLGWQLDYAFTHPFMVFNTGGSHRLGMTIRWNSQTRRKKPIVQSKQTKLVDEYYQAAIKAELTGNIEEATGYWQRIIELEPGNIAAQNHLEELRKKQTQDAGKAASITKETYQKGDLRFRRKPAKLFSDKSQVEIEITGINSQFRLKGQKEYYDNAARCLARGDKYYQNQKFIKALEAWEIVLALKPNHAGALKKISKLKAKIAAKIDRYSYQGIKYFNQKKYISASKQFQLVLKVDPQYWQAGFYLNKTRDILANRVQKYYSRGRAWLAEGKNQQALDCFKTIQKINPGYRNTAELAKTASARIKTLKKTRRKYWTAYRYFQGPRLSSALTILAPLIKNNNYDANILKLFNQVVKQKALSFKYYQRGINHHINGCFDLSIANFHQSLKLDKQSQAGERLWDAYMQKGIQAYRDDDLKAALKAWQKASSLKKNNPLVKKYLERVINKIKYYKGVFGDDYFKHK
ncbi:hypothetical protein KAR34_06120 [bacterium]|nr:hypothetical protein [bacterium]